MQTGIKLGLNYGVSKDGELSFWYNVNENWSIPLKDWAVNAAVRDYLLRNGYFDRKDEEANNNAVRN